MVALQSDPTLPAPIPGHHAESRAPGFIADADSIELFGTWHPDEVKRVEHLGASLLILGHCLAKLDRIQADFILALRRDDPWLLTRWPGAYAGLLLRPGEIVAFTDLAGQFPIYHSRRGNQIRLASHPGILAEIHRRPPDPITAALRIGTPSVLPLWQTRSAFADIARLPGGGMLRASQGSAGFSLMPPSCDSGVEAFRAALTEAIALRCTDGRVSADFSGGLDSTSVAFLAARHAPVDAVVYHNPLVPAADLAEAVSFSRHDRRIRLRVVRGTRETLPYLGLLSSAPGGLMPDEPTRGTLALRRSMLRLEHAARAGRGRIHLTGEGGDAILGAAPSYLSDLARPRELGTLVRHCRAVAGLRHGSAAGLALRAVSLRRTTAARALVRLGRDLLHPRETQLDWPGAVAWWPLDGTAVSWLTPALRRDLAERATDPATAALVGPATGPADMAALTELRQSADAQRHLRELGVAAGVRVHAPFLDNAVVGACLGVPPARRIDLARPKPLLAAALDGLVPAAVFQRRTKGDYSAEEYRGARAAGRHLHALLDDSRLADLGVIEPGPVRACLDRFLAGALVPMGAMAELIATEVWLRALERQG